MRSSFVVLIACCAALCGCGDDGPVGVDSGASDAGAPDAAEHDAANDSGTSDAGDTCAWRVAAPCPVARFEAMNAVLDGELWVMGGFVNAALEVTPRVDIYDPVADTWRRGPDLPNAETHFGVAVDGNDLWIVGGFSHGLTVTTSEVWRWVGADARWEPGPPLPAARAATLFARVGTRLHSAGGLGPDGNTDSETQDVLDLSDLARGWERRAPLPNPRDHGGGAELASRFVAIGGRHGWDEVTGHQTSVHSYDYASDAWTELAPLPSARSEIASSTDTRPGDVLVIGGSIAGMRPSADVLLYEEATGAWRALMPLPEARKGAVTARVGALLVVTTGSPTSTDPSDVTWIGCAP